MTKKWIFLINLDSWIASFEVIYAIQLVAHRKRLVGQANRWRFLVVLLVSWFCSEKNTIFKAVSDVKYKQFRNNICTKFC